MASSDPAIRLATESEIPVLAAVLARAFEKDPFVTWIVRGGSKHPDRMHRFFHLYLELAFRNGEVYTTEDHLGAALWIRPDAWEFRRLIRFRRLPAMLRVVGPLRLIPRLLAVRHAGRHHPGESHYYLLGLGTDPDHQGEGIGSALLAPVLARCDAGAMPAYVEASSPEVVPFYQREGFRILRTLKLPYGGPWIWLMWREQTIRDA